LSLGSLILEKRLTSSSLGKYFSFIASSLLYLISTFLFLGGAGLLFDFFLEAVEITMGYDLSLLKYFSNSEVMAKYYALFWLKRKLLLIINSISP
jgi:hypothetical protein